MQWTLGIERDAAEEKTFMITGEVAAEVQRGEDRVTERDRGGEGERISGTLYI